MLKVDAITFTENKVCQCCRSEAGGKLLLVMFGSEGR